MAEKKKGFDLAATLGSAPGVSKSDTQQGPLAFVYADIDSIHPDPYNAKVYELSDLGGLMDAILLEGGLQQPIYVVPDGDNWTVKSGHRRHAALTALVKGTDKQPPHPELRSVPIVYRPNSDAEDLARITDGDLDDDKAKELTRLMGELRVLIGNMGNRKQTSAELSAAAKELEDHYVALAGMGVRFPGRLRDRVAEACNVSASKLARLKVIRDKLVPAKFVQAWEAGELPEQSAYALAQMPAMLQEAIAEAMGKHKYTPGWRLERIKDIGMDHYLSATATCPSGEGCSNGKGFLARDLDVNVCYVTGQCKCCVTCESVTDCKYACAEGKKKAEAARKKHEKLSAQKKKEAELAAKREADFTEGVAKRVLSVCGGDYESFHALDDELCRTNRAYSETWELDEIVEALAEGEEIDWGDYGGYSLFPIGALTELCRHLGVSADYILGLADDPMTQLAAAASAEAADGKPTWRSMGEPPEMPGLYYLKFGIEGTTIAEPMRYTILHEWVWPSGASLDDVEFLGWYPIPDDDDEEEVEDTP